MLDFLMHDCVTLLILGHDVKLAVVSNDDMSGQKIVLKIASKFFV